SASLHEHPQTGALPGFLGKQCIDALGSHFGHVDHVSIIRDPRGPGRAGFRYPVALTSSRPPGHTMPPSQISEHAASRLASRIWARDPAAFVGPHPDPAVAEAIGNRLGWLEAPAVMPTRAAEIEQFRTEAAEDGLTDVYLLGMGGSSLCAEVLRDTLGIAGYPSRLTVLDTTDERAVRAAA